MQFKRLHRHVRKQLQRQQRQVEDLSQSAEKGIERNLFRRFERLRPVRRFMAGWILLCFLIIACLIVQTVHLSTYYQRVEPIPGGIYSEGIVGTVSNVNPIYATSDVDSSLSRLLFAGLFTYNTNNQLTGDLASGYKVSSDGKAYTVTLKPHETWQDGKPLTSADVAFTYQTIEDPDAQSPLLSSWQGVKVSTPTARTVVFNLPSPLAAFPNNLTTGIIPKHILNSVPVADLRSADFNTVSPVGAGPFGWHGLQVSGTDPSNAEEQVALLPFAEYVGGQPKLSEFIVHTYASQTALQQAFQSGQLTAAAGLEQPPAKQPFTTHSLLLTAGTYVFFKTSNGVLSDTKVRQALVAASQPHVIRDNLGYMTHPVMEPLLEGQLAFNTSYEQKANDVVAAKSILAQDGWTPGAKGLVYKNGQPLTFNLVAVDTPEYRQVTKELRAEWKAVGANVNIDLESSADYTTTLTGHDYDATLYGISIGTDPDVFVYWDSSQADVRSANRLNLSEWKNPTADTALEAGRTRLDPKLRTIKYAPFLQAWQQDAPALGLYQPRYLYVTRGALYGLTTHAINNSTDRFDNVQNWEVRTAKVTE